MEMRYTADSVRFERMNSQELRESFLLDKLFSHDKIDLVYSFDDRAIIGTAVPVKNVLALEAGQELASEYFAERREIGVINIGESGNVTVDGKKFQLDNKDMLYIGKGSKEIKFESGDSKKTSKFYFVSYPAHASYPTVLVKKSEAEKVELGSNQNCNKRTIYKCIRPDAVKSCQLVMGFTELAECNVWNTMPGHTHARRTEVYMYFNVGDDSVVSHFIGKPDQTRHIIIRNEQAVLSPSWSIHGGAGLRNYSFVWAMGGENQAFTDMQGFSLDQLR
ncbi:MAG: 5-dehydro-4-deoxy-D-glucuronate isomerase [Phycisphaerae bacterium]